MYDAHRIRSDFSDFELVECYKRYLPCADACSGGTSGLICGRSDVASGHRLLPVDWALVLAAHVDASKK